MLQSILLLVLLNVLAWISTGKVKMGEGKMALVVLLLLTDIFYLCHLPQK